MRSVNVPPRIPGIIVQIHRRRTVNQPIVGIPAKQRNRRKLKPFNIFLLFIFLSIRGNDFPLLLTTFAIHPLVGVTDKTEKRQHTTTHPRHHRSNTPQTHRKSAQGRKARQTTQPPLCHY